MILQDHIIPANLLLLQLLKKRIPKNHRLYNKILDLHRREMSGWIGEKRIDYPLSKLDFKKVICHSLRLPYYETYFQIDTLLLTSRFFLIIEIKNHSGIISFDPSVNKMIRTYNGQVDYFDDPLIQAEEQKFQLMQLMNSYGIKDIPIICIVVFTQPDAILRIDSSFTNHQKHIVTIHHTANKIREISTMFQTPRFSNSDLIKISKKLISDHQPVKPTVQNEFNFNYIDYLKGTICPECGALPLSWKNRKWECWRCKKRFVGAQINTIKDYYLLFGEKISKKQLIDFAKIDNPNRASHFLKSLKLKKEGRTHQIKHILNFDLTKDFNYLFELPGYAH